MPVSNNVPRNFLLCCSLRKDQERKRTLNAEIIERKNISKDRKVDYISSDVLRGKCFASQQEYSIEKVDTI